MEFRLHVHSPVSSVKLFGDTVVVDGIGGAETKLLHCQLLGVAGKLQPKQETAITRK